MDIKKVRKKNKLMMRLVCGAAGAASLEICIHDFFFFFFFFFRFETTVNQRRVFSFFCMKKKKSKIREGIEESAAATTTVLYTDPVASGGIRASYNVATCRLSTLIAYI